jgi:CheY-like chemotaxis protein
MADCPSQPKVVVLVVEDDLIVRMTAAETVCDAGFDVVEAKDADEAILILESRRDVRIVFTDIDMPGSMDGLKLAAFVRGRWPPIEIIVTSGNRDVSESEMPERSVFMPKPYKHARLMGMLLRLSR